MGRMFPLRLRAAIGIIVTAAVLLATACGGASAAAHGRSAVAAASPTTAGASEATLREQISELFSEHVALAMAATGAALGGRTVEFQAAAAALDSNSVAIANVVGSYYGSDAEQAFPLGWRSHIQNLVDYTQGAAAKDSAKQAQAVDGLNQYAQQIAKFFNAANGMPVAGTVSLFTEHAVMLTSIIDAQAAGDWTGVYSKLRDAMAHMEMIAGPLAAVTTKQFPSRFAAAQ